MACGKQLGTFVDLFGFEELTEDSSEVKKKQKALHCEKYVSGTSGSGEKTGTFEDLSKRSDNEVIVPILFEKTGIKKYKVLARQKVEDEEDKRKTSTGNGSGEAVGRSSPVCDAHTKRTAERDSPSSTEQRKENIEFKQGSKKKISGEKTHKLNSEKGQSKKIKAQKQIGEISDLKKKTRKELKSEVKNEKHRATGLKIKLKKTISDSKKVQVADKLSDSEKSLTDIVSESSELSVVKATTIPANPLSILPETKTIPHIGDNHEEENLEEDQHISLQGLKCSVKLNRDPSIESIVHSEEKNGESTKCVGSEIDSEEIDGEGTIKRQNSSSELKPIEMVYDAKDIQVRKSGRLKSAKCASRYRGDYGIRKETYTKLVSLKENDDQVKGECRNSDDENKEDSISVYSSTGNDSVNSDTNCDNCKDSESELLCQKSALLKTTGSDIVRCNCGRNIHIKEKDFEHEILSNSFTVQQCSSKDKLGHGCLKHTALCNCTAKMQNIREAPFCSDCACDNSHSQTVPFKNCSCDEMISCDSSTAGDVISKPGSSKQFDGGTDSCFYIKDTGKKKPVAKLENLKEVIGLYTEKVSGYQHSVGKSVKRKENWIETKKSVTKEDKPCEVENIISPENSPSKTGGNPFIILESLRQKLFEKAGANVKEADKTPKTFESTVILSKRKHITQSGSVNIVDSDPNKNSIVVENDSCSLKSGKSTPRCTTPRSETNGEILEEISLTLESLQKERQKGSKKSSKVGKPKRQKFQDKKFVLRSMSKEDKTEKRTGTSVDTSCNVISDTNKHKHVLPCENTGSELRPCDKNDKPDISHDLNKNDSAGKKPQEIKKAQAKPKPVKCQACNHTFKTRDLLRKHYPCRIRQTRTWSQNKLRPNRAVKRCEPPPPKKVSNQLSKTEKSDKQRPQLLFSRKTKFKKVKGKRRRRLFQSIRELMQRRQPVRWPHLSIFYDDLSFKEQCLYRIGLMCVGKSSEGLEKYSADDIDLFEKHREVEKIIDAETKSFQPCPPDEDSEEEVSPEVNVDTSKCSPSKNILHESYEKVYISPTVCSETDETKIPVSEEPTSEVLQVSASEIDLLNKEVKDKTITEVLEEIEICKSDTVTSQLKTGDSAVPETSVKEKETDLKTQNSKLLVFEESSNDVSEKFIHVDKSLTLSANGDSFNLAEANVDPLKSIPVSFNFVNLNETERQCFGELEEQQQAEVSLHASSNESYQNTNSDSSLDLPKQVEIGKSLFVFDNLKEKDTTSAEINVIEEKHTNGLGIVDLINIETSQDTEKKNTNVQICSTAKSDQVLSTKRPDCKKVNLCELEPSPVCDPTTPDVHTTEIQQFNDISKKRNLCLDIKKNEIIMLELEISEVLEDIVKKVVSLCDTSLVNESPALNQTGSKLKNVTENICFRQVQEMPVITDVCSPNHSLSSQENKNTYKACTKAVHENVLGIYENLEGSDVVISKKGNKIKPSGVESNKDHKSVQDEYLKLSEPFNEFIQEETPGYPEVEVETQITKSDTDTNQKDVPSRGWFEIWRPFPKSKQGNLLHLEKGTPSKDHGRPLYSNVKDVTNETRDNDYRPISLLDLEKIVSVPQGNTTGLTEETNLKEMSSKMTQVKKDRNFHSNKTFYHADNKRKGSEVELTITDENKKVNKQQFHDPDWLKHSLAKKESNETVLKKSKHISLEEYLQKKGMSPLKPRKRNSSSECKVQSLSLKDIETTYPEFEETTNVALSKPQKQVVSANIIEKASELLTDILSGVVDEDNRDDLHHTEDEELWSKYSSPYSEDQKDEYDPECNYLLDDTDEMLDLTASLETEDSEESGTTHNQTNSERKSEIASEFLCKLFEAVNDINNIAEEQRIFCISKGIGIENIATNRAKEEYNELGKNEFHKAYTKSGNDFFNGDAVEEKTKNSTEVKPADQYHHVEQHSDFRVLEGQETGDISKLTDTIESSLPDDEIDYKSVEMEDRAEVQLLNEFTLNSHTQETEGVCDAHVDTFKADGYFTEDKACSAVPECVTPAESFLKLSNVQASDNQSRFETNEASQIEPKEYVENTNCKSDSVKTQSDFFSDLPGKISESISADTQEVISPDDNTEGNAVSHIYTECGNLKNVKITDEHTSVTLRMDENKGQFQLKNPDGKTTDNGILNEETCSEDNITDRSEKECSLNQSDRIKTHKKGNQADSPKQDSLSCALSPAFETQYENFEEIEVSLEISQDASGINNQMHENCDIAKPISVLDEAVTHSLKPRENNPCVADVQLEIKKSVDVLEQNQLHASTEVSEIGLADIKGKENFPQTEIEKVDDVGLAFSCRESSHSSATSDIGLINRNNVSGESDIEYFSPDTRDAHEKPPLSKENFVIKYEMNGLVIKENLLTGDKNLVEDSSPFRCSSDNGGSFGPTSEPEIHSVQEQSENSLVTDDSVSSPIRCFSDNGSTFSPPTTSEVDLSVQELNENFLLTDDSVSSIDIENTLPESIQGDETLLSCIDTEIKHVQASEFSDTENHSVSNSSDKFSLSEKQCFDEFNVEETVNSVDLGKTEDKENIEESVLPNDLNQLEEVKEDTFLVSKNETKMGSLNEIESQSTDYVCIAKKGCLEDNEKQQESSPAALLNTSSQDLFEDVEVMRSESESSILPSCSGTILKAEGVNNTGSDSCRPFLLNEDALKLSTENVLPSPPVLEKVDMAENNDKLNEVSSQETILSLGYEPPILEPEPNADGLKDSTDTTDACETMNACRKEKQERHFLDVLGSVCESDSVEINAATIQIDSNPTTSVQGRKEKDVNENIGRHFSDIMNTKMEPASNFHLLFDKSENGELTLAQLKDIIQPITKQKNVVSKESLVKIQAGMARLLSKVKKPVKRDPSWLKRNTLASYTKRESIHDKYSGSSDSDSDLEHYGEKTIYAAENQAVSTKQSLADSIMQMFKSFEDQGSIAENMSKLLDILATNLGFVGSGNHNESTVSSDSDSEDDQLMSSSYSKSDTTNMESNQKEMIANFLKDGDSPPSLDDIPVAEDLNVIVKPLAENSTETVFMEYTGDKQSKKDVSESDFDWTRKASNGCSVTNSKVEGTENNDMYSELKPVKSSQIDICGKILDKADKLFVKPIEAENIPMETETEGFCSNATNKVIESNLAPSLIENISIENLQAEVPTPTKPAIYSDLDICKSSCYDHKEKAGQETFSKLQSNSKPGDEKVNNEETSELDKSLISGSSCCSRTVSEMQFERKLQTQVVVSTPLQVTEDTEDSNAKKSKANIIFKSITELNSIETDEESDCSSKSINLSELKVKGKNIWETSSDFGSHSESESEAENELGQVGIDKNNTSKSSFTVERKSLINQNEDKAFICSPFEMDHVSVLSVEDNLDQSSSKHSKQKSDCVHKQDLDRKDVKVESESNLFIMPQSDKTDIIPESASFSLQEASLNYAVIEQESAAVMPFSKSIALKTDLVETDTESQDELPENWPRMKNELENIAGLNSDVDEIYGDSDDDEDNVDVDDLHKNIGDRENNDDFLNVHLSSGSPEPHFNFSTTHGVPEIESVSSGNVVEKSDPSYTNTEYSSECNVTTEFSIKKLDSEWQNRNTVIYEKQEDKKEGSDCKEETYQLQEEETENFTESNENFKHAFVKTGSLHLEERDYLEKSVQHTALEVARTGFENIRTSNKISSQTSSTENYCHEESKILNETDVCKHKSTDSDQEQNNLIENVLSNREQQCTENKKEEMGAQKQQGTSVEAAAKLLYMEHDTRVKEIEEHTISSVQMPEHSSPSTTSAKENRQNDSFIKVATQHLVLPSGKTELSDSLEEHAHSIQNDEDTVASSKSKQDETNTEFARGLKRKSTECSECVTDSKDDNKKKSKLPENTIATKEEYVPVITPDDYIFCESIAEKVKRKQRERARPLSYNPWQYLNDVFESSRRAPKKEISIFRSSILEKRAREKSLPNNFEENECLKPKTLNISLSNECSYSEPNSHRAYEKHTNTRYSDCIKDCSVRLAKLDEKTIVKYTSRKRIFTEYEDSEPKARPPIKVKIKFNQIVYPPRSPYTSTSVSSDTNRSGIDSENSENETDLENICNVKATHTEVGGIQSMTEAKREPIRIRMKELLTKMSSCDKESSASDTESNPSAGNLFQHDENKGNSFVSTILEHREEQFNRDEHVKFYISDTESELSKKNNDNEENLNSTLNDLDFSDAAYSDNSDADQSPTDIDLQREVEKILNEGSDISDSEEKNDSVHGSNKNLENVTDENFHLFTNESQGQMMNLMKADIQLSESDSDDDKDDAKNEENVSEKCEATRKTIGDANSKTDHSDLKSKNESIIKSENDSSTKSSDYECCSYPAESTLRQVSMEFEVMEEPNTEDIVLSQGSLESANSRISLREDSVSAVNGLILDTFRTEEEQIESVLNEEVYFANEVSDFEVREAVDNLEAVTIVSEPVIIENIDTDLCEVVETEAVQTFTDNSRLGLRAGFDGTHSLTHDQPATPGTIEMQDSPANFNRPDIFQAKSKYLYGINDDSQSSGDVVEELITDIGVVSDGPILIPNQTTDVIADVLGDLEEAAPQVQEQVTAEVDNCRYDIESCALDLSSDLDMFTSM